MAARGDLAVFLEDSLMKEQPTYEGNEERETIPHDFIITHVIQTGAKTFILKDLPTSMPSEKGMV